MTIDWGTKVVNVFKTDMVQVQVTPTEIWKLDIPLFKAALGDLLDDTSGMAYPDIFKHNQEITVGGVTLAKVIEILSPYTITFENGQYAVNLINANSNIGDRINVNQVSVRSANSAGLTNVQEIQFSSFQGAISIDTLEGVSGTIFPVGTRKASVNNITDANFIANLRGIEVMLVKGTLSLGAGADLQSRTFKGENAITTTMVISAEAIVAGAQLEDAFIANSVLSGTTYLKHVYLVNTSGISGFIEGSILAQNIGLSNRASTYFVDCKSACVGLGTTDLPLINMAGGIHNVAFRNWSGPVKILNSNTIGNTISFDVSSGSTITIDSTCTAGEITIRGIATVINNGTMTVKQDTMLDKTTISTSVWTNTLAGSTTELKKLSNLVIAMS